MADTQETRDMALKAFTLIDAHVKTCDSRYLEWKDRQDKTLDYLKDMTQQIGDLKDQIAEARGAGKMAKIIAGSIAAVSGFVGGLSSHVTLK